MFEVCSFSNIWEIWVEKWSARRPVSRVLSPPRPQPLGCIAPIDGHSSRASVAERLVQPTRTAARTRLSLLAEAGWDAPSLFGFAPGGVYPATAVTSRAVRSYRTLSPLPGPEDLNLLGPGGLLSVALSLGSPPPGVTRHRFFVEPGLSSPTPHLAKVRGGDRPAVWRVQNDPIRATGQAIRPTGRGIHHP